MKSPYYKVYSGKREISGYAESFHFEDSMEEDDLLQLEVDQSYVLRAVDEDDLQKGKILTFQFGFLAGDVSELHSARITDCTPKYRDRVTLTLKCLDLGTTVKRTTSKKIWKDKTSTQIAEEIADKYGMEAVVEETKKVWVNVPQGNRSDMSFLKYLAAREDGGNYVVFIRSNKLYFVKREMKAESKRTFTYGYGDGKVISFEPTEKESSVKAQSVSTSATYEDPATGKSAKVEVNTTTQTDTGTSGTFRRYYGENGKFKDTVTIGKPNHNPTRDKEEAKNLANSAKKKADQDAVTAKLVIEMDPLLTPNSIITMKNVAKKYIGNWLVKKVTHDIKGDFAKTTLLLASNGTKEKTKVKAADANNTVGGDKTKEKVKVRVYGGEKGDFRGYSSKDTTIKSQGSVGNW